MYESLAGNQENSAKANFSGKQFYLLSTSIKLAPDDEKKLILPQAKSGDDFPAEHGIGVLSLDWTQLYFKLEWNQSLCLE